MTEKRRCVFRLLSRLKLQQGAFPSSFYELPSHLALAARRAISTRSDLVSFLILAFAPAIPLLRRPDGNCSLVSPVAILATATAQPTVSAGRFCPRGPVGILLQSLSLRAYSELEYMRIY